jgi:molybdopterin-guanine dinucleotide biosynthesis protein A
MTDQTPPESLIACSGIILAGGRSRRLGEDKRALRLWGENAPTLLERTCAVLAPLCAELIVVLNDPEAWSGLSARLVRDSLPDGGALGGLYSGLLAAQRDHCLVVAADMPFLNADLLRAMLAYPPTYQALVPRRAQSGTTRNQSAFEPLHAIYRRDCHVAARRAAQARRAPHGCFHRAARRRLHRRSRADSLRSARLRFSEFEHA